jgi:hypothetical protein
VLETIDKELLSLCSACVRFNIPNESVIISWRKAYELRGKLGVIQIVKDDGGPLYQMQNIIVNSIGI